MKKTSKSIQLTTACSRQHPFMYGAAVKPSSRTPSTNVPIQCTLCDRDDSKQYPTFWKYAMYSHIRTAHPRNWNAQADHPIGIGNPLGTALAIAIALPYIPAVEAAPTTRATKRTAGASEHPSKRARKT